MELTNVLPFAVLGLFLVAAVWHDIRARRIPNQLILTGTVAAILLHVLMPNGSGLFNQPAGGLGFMFSMSGFAVGLLALLPFYALRALGAGDVKLMAMVGAYVGPAGAMGATLLTMLFGGLLAVLVAVASGHLTRVFGNVQQMLISFMVCRSFRDADPSNVSVPLTGKLAYAIAIGCGTTAQLLLASVPQWHIFS